jgi:hypothetical protein
MTQPDTAISKVTESKPFFESAVRYMNSEGHASETGGGSYDLNEAIEAMERDARYYAELGRLIVSANVFRLCGTCRGAGYTRRTVSRRTRREKCTECKGRNFRIQVL